MPNTLVCIDASVLINILLLGPFEKQATARLERWQNEEVILVAPPLFEYEVVSTIRHAVHLKQMSLVAGENAYRQFLSTPVQIVNQRAVVTVAWQFAKQFSHSRVYDATYLAVAQLMGCEFCTVDKRLYNSVRQSLNWVYWIGNDSVNGSI